MKRRSLLLALLVVVGLLLTPAVWGKTVVVRVNARNYQELYDHVPFKGTTIDIAGAQTGKTYDLVLDESDLGLVRNCGLASEVVAPDLDFWKSQLATDGSYQSYTELTAALRNLASLYPTICVMESIGPSYQNRWIYGVKISDNPQTEEPDEPEMLVYGQIHAREWAAGQIARHAIDTLLRNYMSNPAFQSFIDNHQLWVFPVLNVDGFVADYPGELWTRKNMQPFGGATGTDLNRNGNGACNGIRMGDFGALVSGSRTSNNPADETFCGPRGLSGTETAPLAALIQQHSFAVELSLHSYSELVLWPYATGDLTPDNTFLAALGTGAAGRMNRLSGGTYTPGQTTILYPVNGGIEDWCYGWSHHVGGFPCMTYVFECGTEFYQPTGDLNTLQTQVFKGFWHLAVRTDSVQISCEGAVPRPFIAHIDTSVDGNYNVHWTPIRPEQNHPDKWELEELQNLSVITDDIEGSTSNWTLQGATVSTAQKHSGTKSIFLGNSSNISNYAMTTDPFPVTAATDSVKFWVWHNLENNYDVGICEVSLDGREWFILHDRYTGNSSGWVRKAYSLAPWLGKSVFIRFRECTDDGTNSGGMYVDDIYPVPAFATRTTISNNITDTMYAFTAKPDGHYYYRVRGHNTAWNWGDKGPLQDVQVGASGIAGPNPRPLPETRLFSTGPNPFSDRAMVNYALGRAGNVKLSVYDASGKLVRELVRGAQNPNSYSVAWDGRDVAGRKVADGIYILRLEADRTVTQQILMLH